jgi:hypothetical protein
MSSTVKTMFWDPVNNGLACVVIVGDVTLPVFDPNQSYEPDGNCLLNDPYEGSTMWGLPVVVLCHAVIVQASSCPCLRSYTEV